MILDFHGKAVCVPVCACMCVLAIVGEYVNERTEREVGRRRVCSSGRRAEGATFHSC